jgi:hypothetical protein
MSEIPDFWPEDIGTSTVVTPVSVLKQEAAYLGPKTKQLLKAEVRTTNNGQNFIQSFFIIAPGLSNYQFQLFQLVHSITLYPAQLTWQSAVVIIADEKQLTEKLKEVLSSPQTRQIVHALIAQIGVQVAES